MSATHTLPSRRDLYYGGADSVVALATARFSDVMKTVCAAPPVARR